MACLKYNVDCTDCGKHSSTTKATQMFGFKCLVCRKKKENENQLGE